MLNHNDQSPFGAIPQPVSFKPERIGRRIQINKPTSWCDGLSKQCPAVAQSVLFFGGLIAIALGCYMVYKPLGPIVAGIFSTIIGYSIPDKKDVKK